jgi:hypothetical protein
MRGRGNVVRRARIRPCAEKDNPVGFAVLRVTDFWFCHEGDLMDI